MKETAYDKIIIEGKYADELCRRYDMMRAESGTVFALLGIINNFRYPLLKGILNLDYEGRNDINIIFHLTDDITGNGRYKMERLFEQEETSALLEWEMHSSGRVTLLTTPRSLSDRDKLTEVATYFANLFKVVMLRMTDKTVEIKKDEMQIPKIKGGKLIHGKKTKNRTVYVRQTVYKMITPPPSPIEQGDRREYERHTLRWTRAGHHRKLRNGVVKWFPEKEIILDPDAIKVGKTYKIQEGKKEKDHE